MVHCSPHHPVREDWLGLVQEEIIAPEQPILDAHHHLWERPEGRYVTTDLMDDIDQGHNVCASLYVQCRTGYRSEGPEELRPLGEVETILEWSKGYPAYPAGIIAFADLQLGEAVRPVLDALQRIAGGKVSGIRNTTAFHPHPAVRSNPRPARDGLLRSDSFMKAAQIVGEQGLCLDIWAYQSQLDEIATLARALPELTIVLNHCGGPLGVGPYQKEDTATFQEWRNGLGRISDLANTHIKIGGFGLSVMGYEYARESSPPHSERLARDWAPYVETCIALFGTGRAMFESNFPVDKGQFSYTALWNAFKRLSANRSPDERADLFWRSAARCYGINDDVFNQNQRIKS